MGTGAGNAEKDTPPQAVEWGGAGKTAGGPCFSGPRPPCNEVYLSQNMVYVTAVSPTGSCSPDICGEAFGHPMQVEAGESG